METVHSGGRPLTRAALAGRRRVLEDGRDDLQKEHFGRRPGCGQGLAPGPALRSILSALLRVWGEQEWDRLVVWPSNEHLCGMTGLSERALRYGLRGSRDPRGHHAPRQRERETLRDPGSGRRHHRRLRLRPHPDRGAKGRIGECASGSDRERSPQAAFVIDLLTVRRRAVAEALHGLLMRFPQTEVSDLLAARESLELDHPAGELGEPGPDLVLEAWGELQIMVEERFYLAASAGNSSGHIEQDTGSPTDPCARAPGRSLGRSTCPDPISSRPPAPSRPSSVRISRPRRTSSRSAG